MKLEKVILENFRSYKDRIEVDIDNLTAFIGKNDIGKSTILEALEIFFNNSLVKIDQEDLCVYSTDTNVRIGCEFSNVSEELIIDTTAVTNLNQEYLLNERNRLEIHKLYDCSKKSVKEDVFLIANFPSIESANDLLTLTPPQLKKRLKDLNIDESHIDLRSNVSMRQGIYKSFEDLSLSIKEITVAKGEAKNVWDKLKTQLPIYSLFQSDRPSLDGDSEVQDPMKLAIKEALETVEEELTKIKKTVEQKALEVAKNTVEKIKDMDESLAKQLTPHFSEEPKWDKIFKLSLDGENSIPINKRGSGVRRLILLNFFRAEAERKLSESSDRGIIYAIEEPETAQHPNNQILLAEALSSLAENGNAQVLLTTHVPGFAGLLKTSSLRFIKELATGKEIQNASESEFIIHEIAETIGVLPPPIDISVKVIVFVEGVHDVESLKSFSKLVSQHNTKVLDLTENEQIVIIPSGGSTLKGWVQNQYLKSFGLPEVHVYDSDNMTPPKYQVYCDEVNNRGDGSKAFSTKKREMENYIHPQAIKDILGVELDYTGECDVPSLLARAVHEKNSDVVWENVKEEKKKQKESNAKKKLNNEIVKAMTYEQLCDMDTEKEIEEWLETISAFCIEVVTQD